MDTTGEKEKRTSKKNVDGRSTSSHDNKKLRTRSMERGGNGVWFPEDGDSCLKNRIDGWICHSFVCLCCVVLVSMHYQLCSVTVCMKVLQNGRFLRFSKRSDCWCAFSWSICNQNGHFIKCIQSSNS